MRTLLVLALVFTAVPQAGPTGDEAEFTRLETRWMDALAGKDEATLQSLLAPEFSIIGVGSTTDQPTGDRASWLQVALARPFPRHEVSKIKVTRVGEMAIVQFVLSATYPPKSLTPEGGRLDFLTTDVWARRNGNWQVLTRHSSLPRAPVVR
jgi:hypothetical protein